MSNTAELFAQEPLRVLVLTGTEPQPFTRLTTWFESWAAKNSELQDSMVVQHGTAAPLAEVSSTDWLLHDDIAHEVGESNLIIAGADLSLIRAARKNGRRIVVVPRTEHHDETTTDQTELARSLARHGHVLLAETERELHSLLDRAVKNPALTVSEWTDRSERAGVELEQIVADLGDGQTSLATVTNLLPTAGAAKVPVLYVGGLGRSGSTLLNDMLGQHGQLVAGGEIVHIWQRGLVENNLCGCGTKFQSCEFWNEVAERAFGGWDQLDLDSVMKAKNAVDRNRFVPHLLAPFVFRSIQEPLAEYGDILVSLLRAIRDVAGVPVVVDSSKQISTALMLRQIDSVDLRIVHLIRDARGVAYSWTKTKKKVEVTDGDALMNQYHPGLMGWRWLSWNVIFSSMRGLKIPVLTVQYEDLITDPRSTLGRIIGFAGVELGDLEFLGGDDTSITVNLEPTHSVAGNPSRFKHGEIALRLDEAWQEKLEPKMRNLVTAIAFPLLRRYGYKTSLKSGDKS